MRRHVIQRISRKKRDIREKYRFYGKVFQGIVRGVSLFTVRRELVLFLSFLLFFAFVPALTCFLSKGCDVRNFRCRFASRENGGAPE